VTCVELGPVSPDSTSWRGGRVLDPVERLSEILFGLIMAMTFTGSIHAASSGKEEIRTMLIGAIGCNLAWGLVDGVMYILTDLVERGRTANALRSLHRTRDPDKARAIVAGAVPGSLASVLKAADLDTVRAWLERIPAQGRPGITGRSLRGALGVFLLVSLSTCPLIVPFLFLSEPTPALRTSHGVALVMLFVVGSAFGRHAGQSPLRTGLWMVLIGVFLVLLTIALGG